MKKVLTAFVLALGLVALAGPTKSADAQSYCGHCCGSDPWGNPVIACTLIQYVPCGNPCWCPNVPGQGNACY